MRDINDMRQVWDASSEAKEPLVLCTLVKTEGSFYRKPGARMVVTQAGISAGMISGGCIENDLKERALKTLDLGTPSLVHLDLTGDDEIYLGFGTGCPGKIWVFMEPIFTHVEPQERDIMLGLVSAQIDRCALIYAAPKNPEWVGRRITSSSTDAGLADLPCELHAVIQNSLHAPALSAVSYASNDSSVSMFASFFTETLKSPLDFHLFGAGPDAQALYEVATTLGWRISVYDHRSGLLSRERFPDAWSLRLSTYEEEWEAPTLGPRSACVVMTHNLPRDLMLLPKLLRQPVPYIGVLGAQKRGSMIKNALLQDSGFYDRDLKRLYTPCGLDLGAQDPWSIGLSIIAEIQATLNQCSGQPLSSR